MPLVMSAPAVTQYKADDFKADVKNYRDAITNKDLPGARTLRDTIANRVMADIELRYSKFEMELTTKRAGFETGADMVQLGATAATAVVGASEIKDLLAASLVAFQGSRISVDKNFFREKTTESIISQMRATRKTKQAQIITNLGSRDVSSYPWDAVWIDLVDFYYAGTVPSALVEIAGATGTKAETATQILNTAIAEQTKQAIDTRTAFEKLLAAANGKDAAAAKSAVESMKGVLTTIGYYKGEEIAADQVIKMFEKAMSDAAPFADPSGAKFKALDEAMTKANLK
jgi:enamine deaminase RidA (YjgF/YER057c/UK114 family)